MGTFISLQLNQSRWVHLLAWMGMNSQGLTGFPREAPLLALACSWVHLGMWEHSPPSCVLFFALMRMPPVVSGLSQRKKIVPGGPHLVRALHFRKEKYPCYATSSRLVRSQRKLKGDSLLRKSVSLLLINTQDHYDEPEKQVLTRVQEILVGERVK